METGQPFREQFRNACRYFWLPQDRGTLLAFAGQWPGNVQDSHQLQRTALNPVYLSALMYISEKLVYKTLSLESNCFTYKQNFLFVLCQDTLNFPRMLTQ